MMIRNEKHSQRVTSAPPKFFRLRPVNRPVDSATINHIKKSAGETWKSQSLKEKQSATTSGGFHASKSLDEPTQYRVRPSSKCRNNRPHPPNVFLVTRLNKIDGCFNPQEAAFQRYGDAVKRDLEGYVTQHRERLRKGVRAKPLQRLYSCLEPSYEGKTKMKTIMGQVPEQTAEKWMKMQNSQANERARRAIKMLQKYRPVKMNFIYTEGSPFHILNYDRRVVALAKQPFYDFQIHPEWHMPWHKHYEAVTLR